MSENEDTVVFTDEEVCPVCGHVIEKWEHSEHIIPNVKIHKECGKVFKAKRRVRLMRRRRMV